MQNDEMFAQRVLSAVLNVKNGAQWGGVPAPVFQQAASNLPGTRGFDPGQMYFTWVYKGLYGRGKGSQLVPQMMTDHLRLRFGSRQRDITPGDGLIQAINQSTPGLLPALDRESIAAGLQVSARLNVPVIINVAPGFRTSDLVDVVRSARRELLGSRLPQFRVSGESIDDVAQLARGIVATGAKVHIADIANGEQLEKVIAAFSRALPNGISHRVPSYLAGVEFTPRLAESLVHPVYEDATSAFQSVVTFLENASENGLPVVVPSVHRPHLQGSQLRSALIEAAGDAKFDPSRLVFPVDDVVPEVDFEEVQPAFKSGAGAKDGVQDGRTKRAAVRVRQLVPTVSFDASSGVASLGSGRVSNPHSELVSLAGIGLPPR